MTVFSKIRAAAHTLALACLLGNSALTPAQTLPAQTLPTPTRGQLLYDTHCITCHTSEMHWRGNRQANDWESLKVQVRLWQGNAGLQWGDADITEVSRYLNDTIYQYPQSAERVVRGPLTAPSRSLR